MYSKKLQDKIIMAIGVIFFIPFFCFAETLFFDNFDSYSTGKIQTVGSSNWITYLSNNGGSVSSGSSFSLPNYFVNNKSSNVPVCSTYDISSLDLLYVQFNLVGSNAVGYNIVLPSLFISSDCKFYSGGVYFQVMLNIRNDDHIWLYGRETRESTSFTHLYDTGYHYNELNSITIEYDLANYNYRVFGSETISDYFPMYLSSGSYADDEVFYRFGFHNVSTAISSVMVDDVVLSETNPVIADGVCGIADGESYPLSVPEADMCQIGYPSVINIQILGDNVFFNWNCTGGNGVKDYCQATMGNEPQEPTCGASHEGFFNNAPSSGLCATGFYRNNSIMETMDGWIWTCGGLYSPTNIQCEAYKNIIDYPDIPELENCESYPLLEKIVCQIKNLFQSAFTPSADKIKELNKALYGIRNKAPFNYLYSVQNIGGQNIEEEQEIEFCILGNCGNVDVLEVMSTPIKILSSFLFSLAFVFWGINYIKRFFL